MERLVKRSAAVFRFAGIYGLVVLLPNFFLEDVLAEHFPPAITHPENFYGFLALAVAFQWVFLLIARDPIRYRSFMLPAAAEKLGFVAVMAVMVLLERVAVAAMMVVPADLVFGILFLHSWWACRQVADRAGMPG